MPAYIDQSVEECHRKVLIGNLPVGVTARQVRSHFQPFGEIAELSLKRRESNNSALFLSNPTAILAFEHHDSVDTVMAERPHTMDDCLLLVRRCIPMTRRYPYEPCHTVTKLLIRTATENPCEALPNDSLIMRYFEVIGGRILRLERLEDQTVLLEFDDYDSVDICCLCRPHVILNQLVDVEKCHHEELARRRARLRQK